MGVDDHRESTGLKKRKESSASDVDADAGAILKLKKEAMALMKPTAAAAAEEQPEKKRRKTKVIKTRLPQGLIDHMIARPFKPIDDLDQEVVELSHQDFREYHAAQKAIADKIFEYEQALINQYLAKGYAEDETEVTVTEDESEEN